MSSYWISCPDVITRETKHHEVDHSIYVYIRQLEHRLDRANREITKDNERVTRFEVIDGTGRSYVHMLTEDERVELSYQDDGRTLKVFIRKDLV